LNGTKASSIVGRRTRRGRDSDVTADHLEQLRRVRGMPTEVGVLLIVSGIGGILLPGPVGTPFLVLGCLMLWPKAFHGAGICLESHFPRMHHHGVKQINRFLDDLERRYPLSK
jgi:hypothetical protein